MSQIIESMLISIRENGLKIQEKLNEKHKIERGKISDSIIFSGVLSGFNDLKGATRLLFKPFQTDNGTYVYLGLMNSKLTLFNKNKRPIIIPSVYEKESKNDKISPSERLVVDLISQKCKSKESKEHIKELRDLLKSNKLDLDSDVKTESKNLNIIND